MQDSIYKTFDKADVYDIERDATTFAGALPVVAHPPCRAWGRLRKFANPAPGERELAFFALEQVRNNGGVLEHPESSKLWEECNLPFGEQIDDWGGWTLKVDQFWWGHKARKRTWLYICGIHPRDVTYPIRFDACEHTVCSSTRVNRKNSIRRKEISKKARMSTPIAFAIWLMDIAIRARKIPARQLEIL